VTSRWACSAWVMSVMRYSKSEAVPLSKCRDSTKKMGGHAQDRDARNYIRIADICRIGTSKEHGIRLSR
jgi:hypothetical protein